MARSRSRHRHDICVTKNEWQGLMKVFSGMANDFGFAEDVEEFTKQELPEIATVTLARSDLENLMDSLWAVTQGELCQRYELDSQDIAALQGLAARLRQEYESVYGQQAATVPEAKKSKEQNIAKSNQLPESEKTVYQFKITLWGTEPPIWRRIQVEDCTLENFHLYIQAAMGWEYDHLYEFEIKGRQYGCQTWACPSWLMDYRDASESWLSDIIPENARRFSFKYLYDFGDCWRHRIMFEGRRAPDPNVEYPICLGGARACPPEDCGGIGGYERLVEALRDKDDEEHDYYRERAGDRFDPEKFDPQAATNAMRRWRSKPRKKGRKSKR